MVPETGSAPASASGGASERAGAGLGLPNAMPGSLDPGMRLVILPIGEDAPAAMHPEEAACLPASAVPKRRREFAAGRACARVALIRLGTPAEPVPAGVDRAPIWPGAVAGSISHSGRLAVAAVALRSSGVRAIGVDVEEMRPLEADLLEEVCGTDERRFLERQAATERGLLAKALFCAKEAAYKCQYGLSRSLFGFDMFRVTLNVASGRFSAEFQENVEPFAAGDRIEGVLWTANDHIFALSVLR